MTDVFTWMGKGTSRWARVLTASFLARLCCTESSGAGAATDPLLILYATDPLLILYATDPLVILCATDPLLILYVIRC